MGYLPHGTRRTGLCGFVHDHAEVNVVVTIGTASFSGRETNYEDAQAVQG